MRRRLQLASCLPRHCNDRGVPRDVIRLIGIYHANGGVRGEIAYVIGSALGRTHCSLCDVTHAGVRRKRTWDSMCGELPIPFDLVHLNERDPDVLAASGDRTPSVLAELASGGFVEVLSGPALEILGGDVSAFSAALERALAANDLAPPRQ